MGKVIVQEETSKYPISLMGKESGCCWGADIDSDLKNYKRGKECLESGHMRVAEFPQVYLILDGYSARVIRELYTHIGGSPTRLQSSTRYIDYQDFNCVIPPSIAKNKHSLDRYQAAIAATKMVMSALEDDGIPREDIANLLPLGMCTQVVIRTNARHLIDMSHQRLCTRAYWEYRQLMKDIMEALSSYSYEWKYLVDEYFKIKCEVSGFCTEKHCCGHRPKKEPPVL